MIEVSKYSGCFLGLALGDAFGAPFEGGLLERLMWRLISKTREGFHRYTDDTQMAMDVSNSFLENNGIDQDHLARLFAANYRWSRGYGPGAAWLLKRVKSGSNWRDLNKGKYRIGSYGNGAAMRAPVIALCSPRDRRELNANVIRCSEITHAHPLAIEGAKIIANATHDALKSSATAEIIDFLIAGCQNSAYKKKLIICSDYVINDREINIGDVKQNLGNGMTAIDSCITSIYSALKYRNKEFEEMHSFICKLGGDVDTISAMAGGMWGAFNGLQALDKAKINRLENSGKILTLSKRLHEVVYGA